MVLNIKDKPGRMLPLARSKWPSRKCCRQRRLNDKRSCLGQILQSSFEHGFFCFLAKIHLGCRFMRLEATPPNRGWQMWVSARKHAGLLGPKGCAQKNIQLSWISVLSGRSLFSSCRPTRDCALQSPTVRAGFRQATWVQPVCFDKAV